MLSIALDCGGAEGVVEQWLAARRMQRCRSEWRCGHGIFVSRCVSFCYLCAARGVLHCSGFEYTRNTLKL